MNGREPPQYWIVEVFTPSVDIAAVVVVTGATAVPLVVTGAIVFDVLDGSAAELQAATRQRSGAANSGPARRINFLPRVGPGLFRTL